MAATHTLSRATPYVERLVDNSYLQDNVRDGVANLRAAYERARRRKAAEAAQDKKLYRRVRRGIGSLAEAAIALKTGREKPKRRGRALIVLAVAGGGIVVATNSGLRERLMSTISASGANGGEQTEGPAQAAA